MAITLIKNVVSTFKRYKDNLKLVQTPFGTFVKSYETIVAEIDFESNRLHQFGYWSQTTQKHINYVANELNLTITK
jgi:hypothetical protein